MKILYVCADRGIALGGRKGAAAHVAGLVGAFRREGHHVVTVSTAAEDAPHAGPDAVVVPPPLCLGAAEPHCEKRLGRALGHVWTNVAVEQALQELGRRGCPDLVYERYGPFGVAAGAVARAWGVPHVLEVNAPLAREGSLYRRQALPEVARSLEGAAFANATHVVAVSEALRDELVEDGADPGRIVVVPNGVDPERFRPEGPRRREGLPDDAVVVGFVGGLRPWHAIDQLTDAFRSLADDRRLHLLVVGDGPMGTHLEQLGEELPGRVTWIRGVDHAEVPAWLRAMDVAVAPYADLERFYFSPLKVLEYMAAGRAVVASAIGQLPDLVRDGENGLLVAPGDAAALARAIRRLARAPSLRALLGEQAAEDARLHHSWDDRAARILALVDHEATAPVAA